MKLGHLLGGTEKFLNNNSRTYTMNQIAESSSLNKFTFGVTGATGPTGARGDYMSFSVGMEAKFEVNKLISVLTSFKAAHVEDYAKAVEVYNTDLTARLKEVNKEVNKQLANLAKGEKFKPFNANVSLVEPMNCEKEYDKLINLFSSMKDDEIKLEFDDANAILNDTWGAVVQAKTTNSYYNGR